jgi:hypothetical protein
MGAPELPAEAGEVTGATRRSNARIHVHLRTIWLLNFFAIALQKGLQKGIMRPRFVTRQPASVTVS